MEDTRTFTSYIARLVALVLAVVLFGLAIWFVVQLFDSDDTEEVTTSEITEAEQDAEGVVVAEDDQEGVSFIDSIIDEDTTITITSDGVQDSLVAATEEELVIAAASQDQVESTQDELPSSGSEVLAVNTESELPNTGPGETLLAAIGITAVLLSSRKYIASRKSLASA